MTLEELFNPTPTTPCGYRKPTADSIMIDAMVESFKQCGVYGEDISMGIVNVLKKMRRWDLLPPCERP